MLSTSDSDKKEEAPEEEGVKDDTSKTSFTYC